MTSSSTATLYQGHSIFRNQPPYTFFNKSFEDPTDALFLELNEIDPYFLQEEQLRDDRGFERLVLNDPRTQQELPEVLYDYTCKYRPKIFRGGGVRSTLTKAQHVVCVRVLKAWQDQEEVSEQDLIVWRKVERQRLKEKTQMLKFIYDCVQTHTEKMYAPAKRLVDLYNHWFALTVEKLLQKYTENVAFNTHAGLPHVRVLKSETGQRVMLTNVELLERRGSVYVWNDDLRVDCQKMHCRLETYAALYNYDPPDTNRMLKGNFEEQLIKPTDLDRFFLPLDTLLFLLTAGDYIDLPTEVLLQIQQKDEQQDKKLIQFEEPLPARNCGWHTHKKVVERAYDAYLSTTEESKWLSVENAQVRPEQLKAKEEIVAFVENPQSFEPLKFDEYLEKHQSKFKPDASKLKHNIALLKWQLKACESDEKPLEILTTLPLPPVLNETATKFMGSHTIKLEYKPQFGCEIMTKYELLSEWLRQSLLGSCTAIAAGKCLRIAVDNFETQLDEILTLARIEQQLSDIYHINMGHLLANLREFLKLLLKMPTGSYLLRYNAKFRDKLLLCSPAQEITLNTVFLHALLKVNPTDLLFMTQPHFLPIADNLCSVVHMYHNVLPCAFLPLLPHQKQQKFRKKPLVFNDREYVLKRVQTKDAQRKAKLKPSQKKKKSARKARKTKRSKLKKAQEQQDAQLMQKEIDMDNLFFGFQNKQVLQIK